MKHPMREEWDAMTVRMQQAWALGLSAGDLHQLELDRARLRRRMRRRGLRIGKDGAPLATAAPEHAYSPSPTKSILGP